MRHLLMLSLLLAVTPTLAAEINVTVEIPRIDASEYHRPYVAVWVEDAEHNVAANRVCMPKETKEWPQHMAFHLRRVAPHRSRATLPTMASAGRRARRTPRSLRCGQPPFASRLRLPTPVVEAVREVGGGIVGIRSTGRSAAAPISCTRRSRARGQLDLTPEPGELLTLPETPPFFAFARLVPRRHHGLLCIGTVLGNDPWITGLCRYPISFLFQPCALRLMD